MFNFEFECGIVLCDYSHDYDHLLNLKEVAHADYFQK
jgi:hypothetical protein